MAATIAEHHSLGSIGFPPRMGGAGGSIQMKLSTDRILTTHAGSMPRGEPLGSMLIEQEEGKRIDRRKIDEVAAERVAYIVRKEVEVGIDIANDGEQGRVGFQTYVPQRWSGFGGKSSRPFGKEFAEFPKFTERMMQRIPKTGRVFDAPEAIGEVHYRGEEELQKEIGRLKQQAAKANAQVTEWFMNAPSPGIIACTMLNAYYDSDEAYLDAIAREISKEYKAIVDAGYVLQVDGPDLAMERVLLYQDLTDAEFAEQTEKHVEALNKALAGIPRDRVRLHVCWGNWEGPHNHDVAMEVVLPPIYRANVGADRPRVRQPASPARDRGAQGEQATQGHGRHSWRDRFKEQFRRAPRSGRPAHRESGGCDWRQGACYRRRRLRLWHLHRLGMGRRGRGVGQAEVT